MPWSAIQTVSADHCAVEFARQRLLADAESKAVVSADHCAVEFAGEMVTKTVNRVSKCQQITVPSNSCQQITVPSNSPAQRAFLLLNGKHVSADHCAVEFAGQHRPATAHQAVPVSADHCAVEFAGGIEEKLAVAINGCQQITVPSNSPAGCRCWVDLLPGVSADHCAVEFAGNGSLHRGLIWPSVSRSLCRRIRRPVSAASPTTRSACVSRSLCRRIRRQHPQEPA